jgi:hypothetical protein
MSRRVNAEDFVEPQARSVESPEPHPREQHGEQTTEEEIARLKRAPFLLVVRPGGVTPPPMIHRHFHSQ